ncbi:sensor histidine kinase [Phaeobacter sp. C3_T13_0]|uniref:sensor histidine kinase n=1 Tax=Phaeobacter cretensis TaxID=3342641 RepID=UPI0039BD4E47
MSALRQALVLSLVFLILLTIGGVLLDDAITEEFRAETEEALREEYQRISARLTRAGKFPDKIDTAEVFSDSGVGYAVLRADGEVLGPVLPGAFDGQGFDIFQAEDLFEPEALETLERIFELLDEDEEDIDETSPPADVEPDEAPIGQISFDVEFENEADLGWRLYSGPVLDGRLVVYAPGIGGFGSDLTSVIIIFVVILSLPALVIGLIFGILAQRRINRIGTGFDRIADGDLELRLAPKVIKDDIDELAARIDGATERLQASVRQMSDFSANIAHDLRTPLTRLRLHLDQAEKAEDQSAHLEAASQQMDDIIAIFGAIQRIARMQSQGRRDGFAPLNLEQVVEQVHEIYEAVAQDAGQTLSYRIATPVTVNADRSLIMQLLANLIENAIRHAGQGASIVIELSENTLRVTDDGPGIPEAERARVLDPLYRLNRSRNTAGAGLGLAMVKAIAELHEAELVLDHSYSKHGLKVAIRFDPL